MIDIEGLSTEPNAIILTIAAQRFDPMSDGWFDNQFYARIDTESQPDRHIDDGTIEWWTTQPHAADEAFNPDNRIPLKDALEQLSKIVWNCKLVWANGPTYDMTILENAFKSYGMHIPWQYFSVRDCRTVYSLCDNLDRPETSHHALEDCRRQIKMLQSAVKQLGIKEIR